MRFDTLVHDVKYAVRRLLRDWRFTLAAVLILGLGIGANTAIFSLVNAALFRPQTVADPSRLVDIYQNMADGSGPGFNSYPAFRDMAEYSDIFESITAASLPDSVDYLDDGGVHTAVAEHATSTYLSVLGLQPALGRWFNSAEDTKGAELVAVVGYHAWTERFDADPSIIGRVVRMNGVPVTIVGVGPRDHDAAINIGVITDFWLPVSAIIPLGAPSRILERKPAEALFQIKARLRNGVTVAQAQAAMQNLGARLASEYPKEDPGKGITVTPSRDVRVHPRFDNGLAALATIALVLVGLVLAIACSNLATLLLVRGAARSKEVSLRLALGAGRRQIVFHLLTESVVLAVAGGVCGCVLAWWTTSTLSTLELPITFNLKFDYRVLTFTTALSLVTGVAFGLAPAIKATKIDLFSTLRGDAQMRSSRRRWLSLKNLLLEFQVAVSVLLVAGATFFLQILNEAQMQPVGFAVDGVAMIKTDKRFAGYSDTRAKNVYEELRQRIAAVPGVQTAIVAKDEPMTPVRTAIVVEHGGTESDLPRKAGAIWAGAGYFDLLKLPVMYGRVIDERDRAETTRVAVISESMARQYFGAVNAVGRRFRMESDASSWMEVIGVVRDAGTADRTGDLVDPTPQVFFRSFVQWGVTPTTILARTSLDASALAGAMLREVRAHDANLRVVASKTMAQYVDESLTTPKTASLLFAALGTLGASLAGVGLYAVIAFAVTQRSREIGIRMALGAQRRQTVWTVTRDVALPLGVGTGVGLMLSTIGMMVLHKVGSGDVTRFWYTFKPDPIALLWIAAFMGIVGLAAAYVPARRAVRMDPMAALRRD